MSTHHIIHCMYCSASATAKDVHANGWRLAKNAPLRYVCTDIRCRALDQAAKEPSHD